MTNTVNDPAAAAIAAATAAAAQHTQQAAPGVTSLPAVQTTGTAVGAPAAAAGPAFSMETVGAGQMSVDAWLKVSEFGLRVGEDKKLFETIKVIIDMTDGSGYVIKQGIKGGNPAQYAYTTNGAVANDGKPWDQACARIRSLAASAAPYPCADLPFIVDEQIVGKDEKTVLLEVGKRLGYTTSTTNWTNWKLFYDEVKKAGLIGQKVSVTLGWQERTNKNNNTWGVVTFKLNGLAAEDVAAD